VRLISRKIWRAFPELDRYDDEVCQRYIARALATRNTSLHRTLLITSIIAAFFVSVTIAGFHFAFLYWFARLLNNGNQISVMVDTFLNLLVFVSFIWMPYLTGLIVRDQLLHRSLRLHFEGAICPKCRYSLVGLELHGPDGSKRVKCPECGRDMALSIINLTEADINPHLA
jgi:hypothetical protein